MLVCVVAVYWASAHPFSSTGIVADVDADAMILLRLSMIVWVDGFEVEEWTSAI